MSAPSDYGIVFDLDGTLIESAPAIQAVGNQFLDTLGLPHMDEAETISFIGGGSEQYVRLMLQARNAYDAETFFGRFEAFMAIYNASSPDLNRAFPGVEEALQELRRRGHALGLCTNKPTTPTLKVLEAMGWTELFDAVVAGDTLPVKKPDPAPLFEAQSRLGCERIVYVGDSDVDAETAERAGLPFILYMHGYCHKERDSLPHARKLEHYSELLEQFSAIASMG